VDEFRSIAELFRPLTGGAPEALDLLDDAAVIPSRPGFDLVITKDALVEGVHFLADDPPDLVARKLLRVNLSDLAAKGAEPYGYFLATAWPKGWDEARKALFAAGLAEDQRAYGLSLFGGDTVSTPGPLTLSVTLLGWVPAGGMVKRSGGGAGDVVLVSGTIGDGALGLAAACGELKDLSWDHAAYLAARYRLPLPRVELRPMLRQCASAAADISDGLLADAGHVALASGLGVEIDLEQLPLSAAATAWIDRQPDRVSALVTLATGGDDYEIVCAVSPAKVEEAVTLAQRAGTPLTPIGRLTEDEGVRAFYAGEPTPVPKPGWTHS
jgi:thiamine-monophosphate kinase